jgi:hypothetical protein
MLRSAREQGLEGVVAKRKDSRYEAGKRSGAWAKFRINSGQELVIGGYVPGAHGVESVIVGYYRACAALLFQSSSTCQISISAVSSWPKSTCSLVPSRS